MPQWLVCHNNIQYNDTALDWHMTAVEQILTATAFDPSQYITHSSPVQLADDAGDMLSVGTRDIKELCRLLEKDHQHLADLRVWRVLAALYPRYCDCESLMPAPNLLILSIAACCRSMSSKYVGRFQLYDLLNGSGQLKG